MEKKLRVIGQMDNTKDHTFEIANRVYDRKGLCPTISTCQGGQSADGGKEMAKIKRLRALGG